MTLHAVNGTGAIVVPDTAAVWRPISLPTQHWRESFENIYWGYKARRLWHSKELSGCKGCFTLLLLVVAKVWLTARINRLMPDDDDDNVKGDINSSDSKNDDDNYCGKAKDTLRNRVGGGWYITMASSSQTSDDPWLSSSHGWTSAYRDRLPRRLAGCVLPIKGPGKLITICYCAGRGNRSIRASSLCVALSATDRVCG